MQQQEFLVGECIRCKSAKRLERARYGFAVCYVCDLVIEASLAGENEAFCHRCRERFSWLWGSYSYDSGFLCLGCANTIVCQICRTVPAETLAAGSVGDLWMCATHAAGADQPQPEAPVDGLI